MKPPLLFLCHRIPFPPNKGDKIRSWNLLRYLCQHYQVYLAAFVDDPDDWQHIARIEEICTACCFVKLSPHLARLNSLSAFVTGHPLSLPYYRNRVLRRWVRRTVAEKNIQRVIVYSSAMAQFALDDSLRFERKVIDFVDVDSDKWRQYAVNKRWPLSWLYRREADYLFQYEIRVARAFDACLFVSSAEARLFKRLAPEVARNVGFYNNGVNTDFFKRSEEWVNPYPDAAHALVFTGAMDYWPNVDAVTWFVVRVFPRIRGLIPSLRFYIVGSKPAAAVRQLAAHPGVTVTGRVEDVRPYLQYALAAVAPMRIARGIQNKVLEAMAMEKPVVVTPQGLEGIDANAGEEVLVADSEERFADLLLQLCDGHHREVGRLARVRVQADFDWADNLPLVAQLLEPAELPMNEPC